MLAWSCGSKRPTWTQPTFFDSSEQVALWSVSWVKHLTAFSSSLEADVFVLKRTKFSTWPSLSYSEENSSVSSTFPFLSKGSQVCPSGVSLLFLIWLDRLLWSPADLGETPPSNTDATAEELQGSCGRAQVTEARGWVLPGLEVRPQLPHLHGSPWSWPCLTSLGCWLTNKWRMSFSSWWKISNSTWQGGGESPIRMLVFRCVLSLFLSSCMSSHPFLKPWGLPM